VNASSFAPALTAAVVYLAGCGPSWSFSPARSGQEFSARPRPAELWTRGEVPKRCFFIGRIGGVYVKKPSERLGNTPSDEIATEAAQHGADLYLPLANITTQTYNVATRSDVEQGNQIYALFRCEGAA
jgi:hypothetical protein